MAKATAIRTRIVYSVHPAVAHLQAMVDNLPQKTGRSLKEWIALIEELGPAEEAEQREWLKAAHGLGGPTAGLIAELAQGNARENSDGIAYLRAAVAYVDGMYKDAKAVLRPIHDALIDLGCSMGEDVKICPCTTIVPLYRSHVFAQIKPATRTRIDFGLALKGVKQRIPKGLVDTGGLKKGDRITHRFPITSLADIDAEVREWVKVAYDRDAE
jgi:Domain of unknown function (DUF5655)/Domain of unknown function (DUF4287)